MSEAEKASHTKMEDEKKEEEEEEADSRSDEELIGLADEEAEGERYLVAARLLRKVKNKELLQPVHHNIVRKAGITADVIEEHLKPPEQGWKKQGESHGHRDTIIYYKVEEHSKLTCRIETPIEGSLLVPLLATMTESELYHTWMPKWTFPFKMGVRDSQKLKDLPGRGAQVTQVTVDMPFPVADREVVYEAWAIDAIDELNLISMKGVSLEVGAEDGIVQPPEPGVKRITFDVGWVIRKCPEDHPCLTKSKHKYPEGEHLLLLSLTQFVDAHVKYVPQALINFSTRTALNGMWASLLQVAEEVRDVKRPDHDKAIAGKKELYGWVNERIEYLFSKLEEQK
jgi:hypothetical protein